MENTRYVTIVANSTVLRIETLLSIPEEYFTTLIQPTRTLMIFYIALSFSIGILLSVLMATLNYLPIRRLTRLATGDCPDAKETADELNFIRDTLIKFNRENRILSARLSEAEQLLRENQLLRYALNYNKPDDRMREFLFRGMEKPYRLGVIGMKEEEAGPYARLFTQLSAYATICRISDNFVAVLMSDAHCQRLSRQLSEYAPAGKEALRIQIGEEFDSLESVNDVLEDIKSRPQFKLLKPDALSERQNEIIAYIEECYMHPDFCIANIAQRFTLSQAHIYRLFKSCTGLSVGDYIERLRMNRALQLLADPGIPIRSIAEQCGYNSMNSFYKSFRRNFGMSCSDYRGKPAGM